MSERRELALQVIDEVEKAVVGKRKILEKIMTAILAGGHILIEDIPNRKDNDGTCFFRAMRLKETRVQFTDVLPADLTGFSIYQKEVYDLREDGISECGRGDRNPQKSAERRGGCGKCFSDFGTDGAVTVTEGSERSLCA